MNERWQTALHEAGHCVVATAIGGTCLSVAIWPDGGGMADLAGLTLFGTAITSAAAEAAIKLLADEPPPPDPDPATPYARPGISDLTPSEELQILATRFPTDAGISDDRAIALYCVEGVEHEGPERWVDRYYMVHARARRVVSDHREKILSVALALFARGVLRAPDIEKEMGR